MKRIKIVTISIAAPIVLASLYLLLVLCLYEERRYAVQGVIWAYAGNIKKAEYACQKALNKNVSMGHSCYTNSYIFVGRNDLALKHAENLAKHNPENSEILFSYAELLFEAEFYESALVHVEKSLLLKKESQKVSLKCSILYELNYYEVLNRFFEDEIPNFRDMGTFEHCFALAADSYVQQKDYESALDMANSILASDETNIWAWRQRALVLELMGRYKLAVEAYTKLEAIEGQSLFTQRAKMRLKSLIIEN